MEVIPVSSTGTPSPALVWGTRTLWCPNGVVMTPRKPRLSPEHHEDGALAGIVALWCDRGRSPPAASASPDVQQALR